MRHGKKFFSVLAILFLTLTVSLSSGHAATGGRAYVDMDGTEVILPEKIGTVVDLWAANNQVLTLLGVAERLVGTTASVQSVPWMQKINPRITGIPSLISGNDINVEEMLKVNPDVIIANQRGLDAARSTRIPVVNLHFSDYPGLKEMIRKTAEIFGEESQLKVADRFIAYFDGNIDKVTAIAKTIPAAERKKVYYIRCDSGSLLNTDGARTMVSEWLSTVGAVNVADNAVESYGKDISFEHIAMENPDVIVLMDHKNAPSMKEELMTSPRWKEINAVKNGKIYFNPAGVFYWERYSAEEAMQILWAGKALYPEKYADIDLFKETKNFYKTFFYYDLTDEEVDDILNTELNGSI